MDFKKYKNNNYFKFRFEKIEKLYLQVCIP